jgi:hypothetical protein
VYSTSLVLDVAVGKYLDTSLIKADVQPRLARLIIKGRLLQLVLPVEVRGGLGFGLACSAGSDCVAVAVQCCVAS